MEDFHLHFFNIDARHRPTKISRGTYLCYEFIQIRQVSYNCE